jgi:hypothetical protein
LFSLDRGRNEILKCQNFTRSEDQVTIETILCDVLEIQDFLDQHSELGNSRENILGIPTRYQRLVVEGIVATKYPCSDFVACLFQHVQI